jgi:hypothetical protein
VIVALLGCVYAAGGRPFVGPVAAAGDPNAYFNSLAGSAAAWKSNSLRSQALIDGVSKGWSPNPWVTYDSTMDAAKARIPPFVDAGLRVASVGPDRVTFTAPMTTAQKNLLFSLRALLVENEIMTVIKYTTFGQQFLDGDTTLLVNRGQFGTALSAGTPGAVAQISQNNLLDQLSIPLGTVDGHRYLFTWTCFTAAPIWAPTSSRSPPATRSSSSRSISGRRSGWNSIFSPTGATA